jgi:hypothetical protein
MNDHVIVAKSQGGRPTKYDPSVIPEVRSWCQMGATVDDLAGFLDVDRATIHRWMLVHPEFCDAMGIGREAADARVERALYERALAGEAWAVNKWLNNRMPREWGGRRSDEAEPSTVTNFIDPRRIIYEQLDDASLRAIENLSNLVLPGPSAGEGDQAGPGSCAGESQP